MCSNTILPKLGAVIFSYVKMRLKAKQSSKVMLYAANKTRQNEIEMKVRETAVVF